MAYATIDQTQLRQPKRVADACADGSTTPWRSRSVHPAQQYRKFLTIAAPKQFVNVNRLDPGPETLRLGYSTFTLARQHRLAYIAASMSPEPGIFLSGDFTRATRTVDNHWDFVAGPLVVSVLPLPRRRR